MKNFLFASKTGTPKSHEQDWMNWVNYHASADGFNWHYDHTDELHIVDGLIDLSYYSVVMLADYQFSSDVPPKFNDFVASGGKVVLVGEGLQQGPRDLGFATHGAASGSTGDVYIIDSSHYILESYSNGQNVTVLASGGSKALRTDQFSGTNLASIESSQEKVMLGESGGYIIWGPWRTSNLAPEGDAISVRVLDYALRTSTIEP
jgi:hypothetical protein